MKKNTKWLSLALASAMVFTMAGCGDSGSGSADTFKIGGIGPITGDAAQYGINVMNGAQLAVDEINAAGGVNGFQLELNFQDDEHNAEKSVNAYNTVKDWGAQMIVGSVTSAPCIAVGEYTKEDNMFQLTPSGTAVDCTKYDNAFRVCFSDPSQGSVSAKYIGEHDLAKKVAIIYDSSDPYSTGIYEAFAAEAANQPFEIVATESYTAETNTDFSVQIQKAMDGGADMVFLPIYYSDSAKILAQAAGKGFAPTWFSCDGMDGILGVENLDVSLTENVMFLTPFASIASDKAAKFTTDYRAKYKDTPNQFAADAYDAVYILKAALEKSSAKPSMSVSELCEAIKKAMVEIKVSGVTGDMTWEANGEPTKTPMVVKISGGEYTILE